MEQCEPGLRKMRRCYRVHITKRSYAFLGETHLYEYALE